MEDLVQWLINQTGDDIKDEYKLFQAVQEIARRLIELEERDL